MPSRRIEVCGICNQSVLIPTGQRTVAAHFNHIFHHEVQISWVRGIEHDHFSGHLQKWDETGRNTHVWVDLNN